MQVTQFCYNASGNIAEVVASGQPHLITFQRSHRPYATVLPADLYDELVEAAGTRGQEVLEKHREAAEQRKQEVA